MEREDSSRIAVAGAGAIDLPAPALAEAVSGTEAAAAAAVNAEPATEQEAPAAPTADETAPTEQAAPAPAEEPTAASAAVQKDAAPIAAPAARAAASDAVPAMTLQIGELASDGSINTGTTEDYTFKSLSGVVDLRVSDTEYSTANPYLIVSYPSDAKVSSFEITASTVGETTHYTENGVNYVRYDLPSLYGGMLSSFPYTIKLGGLDLASGEEITVDAVLHASDGTVLKEASKTYKAKSYDLVATSRDPWGNGLDAKDGVASGSADANGHLKTEESLANSASDTTMLPGQVVRTSYYLGAKVDNGQSNSTEGLIYPKNLKYVLTVPKGVSVDSPSSAVSVEDRADGSKVYTFVDTSLYHGFGTYNFSPTAGSSWGTFLIEGAPFNEPLSILLDVYRDVAEDGTGGTFVGHRNETVVVSRKVFTKTGSAEAYQYDKTGAYGAGRLYDGSNDVTETGLELTSVFLNRNNGSGPDSPTSGGNVSDVTELAVDLGTPNLKLKAVRIADAFAYPSNEAAAAAAKKAFDEGNTKLFGIRADGSEVLLKEQVKLGDTVDISALSTEEFQKMAIRPSTPVAFDNFRLNVYEYVVPTAAGHEALAANPVASYRAKATITANGATASDRGDIIIAPARSEIGQALQSDQSVTSTAGGTRVYWNVGATLERSDKVNFLGVSKVTGVKSITLLPDGVTYDGMSPYDAGASDATVELVENYHGTGKTAVIVSYPDLDVPPSGASSSYALARVTLYLNVSQSTQKGTNPVYTYLVYDNNGVIHPKEDPTIKDAPYVDALDLDEDGDTTETFSVTSRNIDFTPPMELALIKDVSRGDGSGTFGRATTADLGDALTYRLTIANYSRENVTTFNLIDALPFKGDHALVENGAGAYVDRGSMFVTGLTKSLESVNPAAVNDLFTFYYQTTPQGADLASVRDGAWVTADKVSDFSAVKSIKAVLKDGKSIASNATVAILIPSAMPSGAPITGVASATPDKAVNSAAFSVDSGSSVYTEANSTSVFAGSYEITGVYFADENDNARFDAGIDKRLAGRVVKIVDEDGNPAKDPSGADVTATTDANGSFSAIVYQRGTYRAVVTKGAHEDFVTATPEGGRVPTRSTPPRSPGTPPGRRPRSSRLRPCASRATWPSCRTPAPSP